MSYERLEDVRRRENHDVHVGWLVAFALVMVLAVMGWVFWR
jgi:hypothetical protein